MINKPKEYIIIIIRNFPDLYFFTKYYKVILLSNINNYNSIVIIINLDLIYNNFDTKKSNFLNIYNKLIKKIY